MKRKVFVTVALCSSLSLGTLAAGFDEETEFGSAERGSSGVAETAKDENASDASGAHSITRGSSAGKPKPAGTGSAAGYIFDQAQKGNIKIEGAIDGQSWD